MKIPNHAPPTQNTSLLITPVVFPHHSLNSKAIAQSSQGTDECYYLSGGTDKQDRLAWLPLGKPSKKQKQEPRIQENKKQE